MARPTVRRVGAFGSGTTRFVAALPTADAPQFIKQEVIMPLGRGVRYRVKHTSKGRMCLAFRGDTVIETKNLKTGELHELLSRKAKGRKKK